ncbi:hypothetical protein ACQJBY_046064 [Aegilops geniculata]
MNHLKKVTILVLINTILSMSTWTRELSKCALLSKVSTQKMRDILTSRICTEDMGRSGKLSMDHGGKLLRAVLLLAFLGFQNKLPPTQLILETQPNLFCWVSRIWLGF